MTKVWNKKFSADLILFWGYNLFSLKQIIVGYVHLLSHWLVLIFEQVMFTYHEKSTPHVLRGDQILSVQLLVQLAFDQFFQAGQQHNDLEWLYS